MHRGIGTHEGEAVWQGKDEWEEGVGVEEEQAATLAHAEQPSLADEQVGQTRSPRLPAPKQHHQHTNEQQQQQQQQQ